MSRLERLFVSSVISAIARFSVQIELNKYHQIFVGLFVALEKCFSTKNLSLLFSLLYCYYH